MKILVTGGAGYIGSITAKELVGEGYEVVVFDNLSNGHKEAVSGKLIIGDLLNKNDLFEKLKGENFDAVIHFAALALAGESMEKPSKYLENNIQGGLNLLEFMRSSKIKHIVFSSSCAVYGTPENLPVVEDSPKHPESVYGETKYIFEKMLYWYDQIYGIKHINLRYFNAAGASLNGELGENHSPETHIIPVAIKAALGKIKEFELFGRDYPTFDGTCIRDYIHVLDLAQGHILALKKLQKENVSNSYNIGAGIGYSNLQIIDMVKKVSGKNFSIKDLPKRAGDPPEIFANNDKIVKDLSFAPRYSDLETIVRTAWEYHSKKG